MLRKTLMSSLAAVVCLAAALPVAALADSTNTAKDEALAAVLAAQPEKIKDRYAARHPVETLKFFDVRKGDTIIETLPGRGWYSGILYPYLGETGKLIGAQYPKSLFERFGWDEKRLQTVLDRNAKWPKMISDGSVSKGGEIDSFTMTEMPDRLNGFADKVLFIRSLHNLNRFNKDTGYVDTALKEAFRSLKPGGIVGVVQHRAPESASDAWADGSNGYLKQSKVIAAFEAAGFKFVEARDINANAKDRPSEKDFVWRLPPTLRGADENSDEWRKNKEIGESNRMTLKFVKPSE